MVQIPLGGHSMEATGGRKEVPAFALLARLPACSLLSPKSWRCDNEACRAVLNSMCFSAHLHVAMPWRTLPTISTPLWLVVQRSKQHLLAYPPRRNGFHPTPSASTRA